MTEVRALLPELPTGLRRRLHDLSLPPERGRQSAVLPNLVIRSTSPKFGRHAPLLSLSRQKQLAYFRGRIDAGPVQPGHPDLTVRSRARLAPAGLPPRVFDRGVWLNFQKHGRLP